MHATPDDLFAMLDRLAIAHATAHHPAVFTVAESRGVREQAAGARTKNLFLKDKRGALFLVVACEDATIALKALHRVVGASGRLSFGSAEQLYDHLGVAPGSVTPFSAINDHDGKVTVVLDAAMMAHEVLNFHPLINTMTTTIARGDLVSFLKATGHVPRIVALPGDNRAANV